MKTAVSRVLFREKVVTFPRLSPRGEPLTPHSQRTAVFCIESVERTTLGLDLLGSPLVTAMVFDIDGGCDTILLPDSMNVR